MFDFVVLLVGLGQMAIIVRAWSRAEGYDRGYGVEENEVYKNSKFL